MTAQEAHAYRQFQQHFTNYYSPLCNYAFTFVNDRELSEDIVQELFTKIWEEKRELVMSESIRFYLFTAVRNNCISHLRKEKRSPEVGWEEETAAEIPIVPGQKEDYRSLLLLAIEALPPKCREIFLLSRMGNLSYKEIAEFLGLSVKTVENQLGKALKIMRNILREHGIYLIWLWGLVNLFCHAHGG